MISSLLKKTTKTILHEKFELEGDVFTEECLIGEGAYAYVYRVRDSAGKSFALKKLICQTEEQIKETKKEMRLLSLIKHPNVLCLLKSSFHTNNKKQTEAFLLLPLYGKSAQDVIESGEGYPHCAFSSRCHVQKIVTQCIDAIAAIHESGYTHCDFKPANVLLDEDFNAVVTDFGSASPLVTEINSRNEALYMQDFAASNTTASFRPPELFDTPSSCIIDGKVDVWGLGCTIFALMFSRTPFENPAEGGLSVLAVMSSSFQFPPESKWPPEYHNLVKASLRPDFEARLSIEELKILAGMLPNPETIGLSGSYGSPDFETQTGIQGENLFADSSVVSDALDQGFAHFEAFGNDSSDKTVFNASAPKQHTKHSKKKMDIAAAIDRVNIDAKQSQNENDDNVNYDNNDDDMDFGDFVQAEGLDNAKETEKPKENVSISCDAYFMKDSRSGPFRTKNRVKRKIKLVLDNTWLCIKKIEDQPGPGKIYFDGVLAESSTVERVDESPLGCHVLGIKSIERSDDRRNSLTSINTDEDKDKTNHIDIGFENEDEMVMWMHAIQSQIASCVN